ncbi:MAG: glycerate kinase [Potamolinea sp.]
MSQPNISLSQILNNLATGHTLSAWEWQYLITEELALSQRAKAFGITQTNAQEILQERSLIFHSVYPDIFSLPFLISSPPTPPYQGGESKAKILLSLWKLWIPLAMQLSSIQQKLGRPFVQGILGGQGTGKTTLCAVLSLILKHLALGTLSLSLDDLYKTYSERQHLQKLDPRLGRRGPPGTHDLELGKQVLDQLRTPNLGQPILVPRFEKSAWGGAGDRTDPEMVKNIDIVLFEGWFVGVRPIDPTVFDSATPEPIQTAADRSFARDMNQQLREYLPLWERLDRLMLLYPTDYHLSQQWRLQAEQQMITTGKSGMSTSQIGEFVNYFWRSLHPELFITPLTRNPNLVDLVIEINSDHSVGDVYRPGDA